MCDFIPYRRLVFCCLFLTLSADSVFGQGSVSDISPEEWDAMPGWEPAGNTPGANLRSVDLRFVNRNGYSVRAVPEVGIQEGNSCSGWAVAYACRSYQESIDQDWVPDKYSRIMSPAFLYNLFNIQNNSGDDGAPIRGILDIAKRYGCATWASMPHDSNFLRRPSSAAMKEAANFRITGYQPIKSGHLIRRALSQGNPVVVHVHAGAVFGGGKFRIYSVASHQKDVHDMAQGNRPEKHMDHAMCVVGYDDDRHAFLLQNSWGRNSWCNFGDGYEGLGWVDYDVMERIGPSASNFLWYAYKLQDQRLRVNRDTPVIRTDNFVEIRGGIRYNGIENGAHSWAWMVSLAGNAEVLEQVQSVDWSTSDGQRMKTGDGFEAVNGLTTAIGRFTVHGTVRFRDQSTVRVSREFRISSRADRTLQLVTSDRYWGRHAASGKSYWEWTVRVAGSLPDLADVRQVTYHLHPTFTQPNVTVRSSSENGFALTQVGFGTFRIGATVEYVDGTRQRLETDLQFRDRTTGDELRLTNTSRWAGVMSRVNGLDYYNWTAFIDGPQSKLRDIQSVRYRLHSSFPDPVRDVHSGPETGFALSTHGWGIFTLRADVTMKDGRVIPLRHRLVLKKNANAGATPLAPTVPTKFDAPEKG